MKKTTTNVEAMAETARDLSYELASTGTERKNRALASIADALKRSREQILEANQRDVDRSREEGLDDAMVDRLLLTPDRIDSMIEGIHQVIQLEDPVGEILSMHRRPNGLKVGQQRVPLGVIVIIYESRPNVTVDAAVLCLKAGNSTLLRGGSEARETNYLLVDLMQEAMDGILPRNTIQIMRDQDHALVDELLQQDEYLDVVIPRGGQQLIETVAEKSRVPVIKHYKGVCHTYVSDGADLEMAHTICINAKTQRTSVCNAMETLVVHEDLPDSFVKGLFQAFVDHGVELRLDDPLLDRYSGTNLPVQPATDEDWSEEYLDAVLSVREVSSLDQAIDHINTYGSNHSDAIVTERYAESERFLNEVDSAAVYVNASTRFTDGYEFGLGAEIGISTERLHARGPMGLRELTIPKYVIYGQGQIRG